MIPGIEDELARYLAQHPDDRVRLLGLIERVGRGEDLSRRKDMLGHAVSSIMTLDRSRRRALLIHHRAYGLWIPPGGHLEKGWSLYLSGLRERCEETGLLKSKPAGGSPCLIDIDTHPIPARPDKAEGPHVHHDFMYLELVDHDFEPRMQIEEVSGAEWCDLDDMARLNARNARLVERVRAMPADMLA